ncbi:hypothetical protein DESUT3_05390 [Desulfuromonas versatilis]|uniref:DUF302 domain-containing protein n=1 Tax=Desulfuromonas versatilis TaxID=2802975 RepID=A0ABM9SDD7_9BACT|nr:DUF302 domain-containing protein [Desulfuromonas versatilis]BCR03470.1 hypothetical protein DESUT3_05390 [Desulfuromonas versatilis]
MAIQGSYFFGKTVPYPFDQTVARVKEALQEQGFGILTEIDVQDKLREKLGVSFRPYRILGACNPAMAHRALQAEINLGVLLPCNVVVYVGDDDRTQVVAMDPVGAMGMVGNPAMETLARQVKELLARALDNL